MGGRREVAVEWSGEESLLMAMQDLGELYRGENH